MAQRLKWMCEKCGWDTGEIEYHPSPENMDVMLAGLMPKHKEESPDCVWDTSKVMVFHIEGD